MNAIVSKFLLAGNKFMPELHLKQLGFTYSACALFSRNKEKIEKFMEKGNTGFIYRNELDKFFFNMIDKDKVLRDKAFKILSDPKYDGYQRGLASIV